MKKIGKFLINPEKVVKHDDLLKIRGGYGEGGYGGIPCTCTCFNMFTFACLGYIYAEDGRCENVCFDFYLDPNITGECGNLRICSSY